MKRSRSTKARHVLLAFLTLTFLVGTDSLAQVGGESTTTQEDEVLFITILCQLDLNSDMQSLQILFRATGGITPDSGSLGVNPGFLDNGGDCDNLVSQFSTTAEGFSCTVGRFSSFNPSINFEEEKVLGVCKDTRNGIMDIMATLTERLLSGVGPGGQGRINSGPVVR